MAESVSFTRSAVAMVQSQTPTPQARNRRADLDFEVLSLLEADPGQSQREIASRLGVSLGRINACMKALVDRGAIRRVASRSPRAGLLRAYELTAGGIAERLSLAASYRQRKLVEFDRLKAQIDALQLEPHAGEGT